MPPHPSHRRTPDADLLAFAKRLVSTPSLPGEEYVVGRLVASELERLGYRDVSVDEFGNVVAFFGRGQNRLMFNGHLDHVPPAGMDDPYSASVVDGKPYGVRGPVLCGRGSCDMKANVAAGAYAVAHLPPAGRLSATYVFTADVQEETDSPLGIQALLDKGLKADMGVSGEPTSLRVAVGHRGKVQFDVRVQGRSSHASTPNAGVNAVFRALPFLEALEHAGSSLPRDDRFGDSTLTVTGIESEPQLRQGVAVVPRGCTIRVDRRYGPGETPQACEREVRGLVASVAARTGFDADVELVNVYPLMSIDPGHALVMAASRAVQAELGRPAELMAWRFGVNGTFMQAAGIPTVGIGPGSEDFAHTAEEHVPVAEVLAASRIYARLFEEVAPME